MNINLTNLYGQGKSFLLTFKAKADPEASTSEWANAPKEETDKNFKSDGLPLSVGWALYNGAVKNWANKQGGDTEYYDFPGGIDGIAEPWSGPWSEDEVFEDYVKGGSSVLLDDNWVEYKRVIAAKDIEEKVDNTGVYYFAITFSMGTDAIGGYSYLLDDVQIIDLNPDIERLGQTAFRPEEPEEPEVPEEPADPDTTE